MGHEANLTYENFVRDVFAFALEKEVDRYGDPAGLADTDVFSAGDLYQVKVAVSYSMSIFNNIFSNQFTNHPIVKSGSERMETIVQDVLNAPDKQSIIPLINEYKGTFFPIMKTK